MSDGFHGLALREIEKNQREEEERKENKVEVLHCSSFIIRLVFVLRS